MIIDLNLVSYNLQIINCQFTIFRAGDPAALARGGMPAPTGLFSFPYFFTSVYFL